MDVGDFTLRIFVTPPEQLEDETVTTVRFQKQVMDQMVAQERRVERAQRGRRRIAWAQRLLVRFGFGLPGARAPA
jgi:hypothetical protein